MQFSWWCGCAAEFPSLMLLLLPETGSTPAFLPKYSTLWFSVTFSILSSCWWYSLWLWCKAEFKQRSVLTARLTDSDKGCSIIGGKTVLETSFYINSLQIPPSFYNRLSKTYKQTFHINITLHLCVWNSSVQLTYMRAVLYQDPISNSPYCLPNISHYVSLENLVSDQLVIL